MYTQIFRAQACSCSGAYTESSKSQGPGRICILKFSGPGQDPVLGRIQDTRKNWAQTGHVYSNFQGPGRILFWGVYRKLEESGSGQNLYTQIFRARAGSRSKTYTCILKKQGLRRLSIQARRRTVLRLAALSLHIKKPGIRNFLSWLLMNLHGLSFYLAIESIQ